MYTFVINETEKFPEAFSEAALEMVESFMRTAIKFQTAELFMDLEGKEIMIGQVLQVQKSGEWFREFYTQHDDGWNLRISVPESSIS